MTTPNPKHPTGAALEAARLEANARWAAAKLARKSARRNKAAERRESDARIAASRAEAGQALAKNACPRCGRPVRRNLALAGWVQCSQFGAVGFRADAAQAPCEWQGFAS